MKIKNNKLIVNSLDNLKIFKIYLKINNKDKNFLLKYLKLDENLELI